MKPTDLRVTDLLAAFRSPAPTPGGGSASALAGALGAALLTMVAELPRPNADTEQDVERLRAAGAIAGELSQRLTALVDRDSEAYDQVMHAYRLPKTTDQDKAARSTAIQNALRAATEPPLDVMRACRQAMEQAAVVARLGNRNASSDVQVALELLTAGLRGAMLNVEINLPSVKDAEYVARVREEIGRLQRESAAMRGSTGSATTSPSA